jgi:Na+-translocating ferredoxin:NAD+ oxidoreductase RnfG subunit
MKKLSIVLLILLLFFCEAGAIFPPEPEKRVVKEVTKLFSEESILQEIPIPSEVQAVNDLMREGDQPYAIKSSEGILGYVFSTSAKGRYDYFDYSIIYSKDLSVMVVLVTTYRSSHGAGICSKGWLKQFKGYQGEEISLGKDIDSISGATLSATSMVEDMKRCYLLMEEITGGLN